MAKIKEYHVAWYDMERNGNCFDESFYPPEKINEAIHFVETIENENWCDRCRVFVYFDDGERYELKLERIEKGRICNNFYN